MAEAENEHLIRVGIIGDPKVGKTCILYQLFSAAFHDQYQETYGVEFAPLIINLDEGRNVDIQLCDVGGGESSKTMAMSVIKTCPLVIVVYDITSQDSFKNVDRWISEVKALKDKTVDKVKFAIVANKTDLTHRVINTEDGEKLAEKYGAIFGEVSAKQGTELQTLIKKVGQYILENHVS